MENKVIIIQDLISTRERKQKELHFYQDELHKLQEKMKWLRMEIKLTEDIIEMIEKEKMLDIKDFIQHKKS